MLDTLLQVGPLSTSPLELVSFSLALINVFLNIRQNHWAWFFAIVSSLLYGFVFVEARLYGDAGLQLMFIMVSCWGWYQWRRMGAGNQVLVVTTMGFREKARALSFWLFAYLILAYFLARFTDTDVPKMDGFLTAGSVLGQLLLSRKRLENWLLWIVVDTLYVGLYVYKGLYLTAILYAIFIGMAWSGYRIWRAVLVNQPS